MKKLTLIHILNNIINESTFKLMHNKEKAPYFGDRFGQNVEPSGYYSIEYMGHLPENWELVELTYNKPLIIPVTEKTLVSWKFDLAEKMKAKKQNLSKKLMSMGYDVIVTQYPNGETGEIIVLDTSKLKPLE